MFVHTVLQETYLFGQINFCYMDGALSSGTKFENIFKTVVCQQQGFRMWPLMVLQFCLCRFCARLNMKIFLIMVL